jgi:solute carrier family 9 (sodium/hydrogen exchanger), member 3
MFEGFIEIRPSNIKYSDVLACMASVLIIIFGSPMIGIAYGFAGGLMSRFTYRVRVIEPLIVFVFGYLSYLTAEMFHLSGILS